MCVHFHVAIVEGDCVIRVFVSVVQEFHEIFGILFGALTALEIFLNGTSME